MSCKLVAVDTRKPQGTDRGKGAEKAGNIMSWVPSRNKNVLILTNEMETDADAGLTTVTLRK
jgi:hypothetical protein